MPDEISEVVEARAGDAEGDAAVAKAADPRRGGGKQKTDDAARARRLGIRQIVGVAFTLVAALLLLESLWPVIQQGWARGVTNIAQLMKEVVGDLLFGILGVGLILKRAWALTPAIILAGICAVLFGTGLVLGLVYGSSTVHGTAGLGIGAGIGLVTLILLLAYRK